MNGLVSAARPHLVQKHQNSRSARAASCSVLISPYFTPQFGRHKRVQHLLPDNVSIEPVVAGPHRSKFLDCLKMLVHRGYPSTSPWQKGIASVCSARHSMLAERFDHRVGGTPRHPTEIIRRPLWARTNADVPREGPGFHGSNNAPRNSDHCSRQSFMAFTDAQNKIFRPLGTDLERVRRVSG